MLTIVLIVSPIMIMMWIKIQKAEIRIERKEKQIERKLKTIERQNNE
jgi:uncharacterized membrane protein YciS (DUF1049 family)